MLIKVKRVYDTPANADGTRLLIDRLWPRGVSKKEARITDWAKDLAPSSELRSWFHEDPESRFKEFKQKYTAELKRNKSFIKDYMSKYKKTVTLVTSVKEIDRSHVPTLKSFLEKLSA